MGSPPWAPEPALSGASYSAAELSVGSDRVFLLDQRRLPVAETYVDLGSAAEGALAIRDMVVRGAPAIGVAAAYGMVLAARAAANDPGGYLAAIRRAADELTSARPTAVNLAWAVGHAQRLAEEHAEEATERRWRAMAE